MPTSRGYVVWEGPSRINQKPIVAIVTLRTKNAKTGDMPQVWFLPQRSLPTTSVRTGYDEAVCGNCAFRPINAKETEDATCYVTLIHGPNQIWRGYKEGLYPDLPRDYRFDRPVRIGSYGDPASVPLGVLRNLVSRCDAGWTAYTHQWRRYPALHDIAMASVNDSGEQSLASSKGWRTFRVIQKQDGETLGVSGPRREILCPAGAHDGYATGERTTCAKCRICDGMRGQNDRRADIAVYAH